MTRKELMVPHVEEQPRRGRARETGEDRAVPDSQAASDPRTGDERASSSAPEVTPASVAETLQAEAGDQPAEVPEPEQEKPAAKARRSPVASNAAAHAMRLLNRARGTEAAAPVAAPESLTDHVPAPEQEVAPEAASAGTESGQEQSGAASPVAEKTEAERPAARTRRTPVASNAAAHAMRLLNRARGAESAAPDKAPSGPLAVVIGGGISGLVAARELAISGHRVQLHEASASFGGCVQLHEVAGLRLDAGAESFATRSTAVADLLGELGLGQDIITPQPGGAWLYLKRGTEHGAQPLPATGILGIPGDPWAEEVRSAVGRTGALRAAADLITPVSKKLVEGQMSLGALVRSRMGSAVLQNLVTPVVSGVHSADPDTLDVDAIAPGLRAAVLKHGSLARAVASMRAAAPAGSAVASVKGGMNKLVSALVADLLEAGVELFANSPVAGLEPQEEATGFLVRLAPAEPTAEAEPEHGRNAKADKADKAAKAAKQQLAPGPREVHADRVVLATGGGPAIDLLAGIDAAFEPHRPSSGAGIALVTLVIDKPELDDAPRGTGLLVAPSVENVGAKALTHATAKWQWLGDASGPGSHVLRLSYGRLNDVASALVNADDNSLRSAALKDASVLLGLDITSGDVLGFDVVRYSGALPFATTGHAKRVAEIRALADTHPGLDLVGAWLAGTGLASVIADTRKRLRITAS
ncbi:FAD-dependent oxidoreductase [Paeniglutamicibacter gangotriensis]|uniref:protoporphyrinogen/coproporphyrinogen oxidase n=1 Tax=Paeniglutamicibacter gangotriensis TaxID=254787 RepID=UPI0037C95B23